jgi:hypothetical protein
VCMCSGRDCEHVLRVMCMCDVHVYVRVCTHNRVREHCPPSRPSGRQGIAAPRVGASMEPQPAPASWPPAMPAEVAAIGPALGPAAIGPVGPPAIGPVGPPAIGPEGPPAIGPVGPPAIGPMGPPAHKDGPSGSSGSSSSGEEGPTTQGTLRCVCKVSPLPTPSGPRGRCCQLLWRCCCGQVMVAQLRRAKVGVAGVPSGLNYRRA